MTPELVRCITELINTAFDCGKWEQDTSDIPYETVYLAQRAAHLALMNAIAELVQQAKEEQ